MCCRVRNQVKRITRKEKMSYEKDIASNAKTNPTKFGAMQKRRLLIKKAFYIFKLVFVMMKAKVYL